MLSAHDHEAIDAMFQYWVGISTFLILEQGAQIMAAIDDLNNAVTNLQTQVTDLDGRVGSLVGANDPAIVSATQAIQAAADHLATLAQPTA